MKIMFICHGNICRSPMAEFVFKRMLQENRVPGTHTISSCATSEEEIRHGVGNPIYPPALAVLARHGIVPQNKRAVRLTREDYDRYDLFICMDKRNLQNALSIFGSDPENKLCLLLSFAGENRGVADPWYTGDFDEAYRDIVRGCKGLLNITEK